MCLGGMIHLATHLRARQAYLIEIPYHSARGFRARASPQKLPAWSFVVSELTQPEPVSSKIFRNKNGAGLLKPNFWAAAIADWVQFCHLCGRNRAEVRPVVSARPLPPPIPSQVSQRQAVVTELTQRFGSYSSQVQHFDRLQPGSGGNASTDIVRTFFHPEIMDICSTFLLCPKT